MKQNKIKRTKLHKYLKTNCIKVDEFAVMVNVNADTVRKWLYTNIKPREEVMRRIARRLGLEFDEVQEWFPSDTENF